MLGEYTKRKSGYLLEQIRVGNETIVDADEIHRMGTDHFSDWMSTPSTTNARGIGAPDADYNTFMNETFEQFQERYEQENIPASTLRAIWNGFCPKVRSPNHALAKTHSFDELDAAIRHLKTNSAPGMSGLSYNMIKTWPQEVREAVYNDLRDLWERREFPDDWTWRWLAPIPKVPDPSLNHLCPLSLLEALRKTWCSIFVRRIQHYWRNEGCLNDSQHGGVKGRGTGSAVLEMINALETAHDTG
jgi:hypothetical protein